MEMWTEIRRKVLVEGASKRSILRDYGIGHQALGKILENPEPPGYQVAQPRPKPKLGPFLAVIDQILERRPVPHRSSSATRPGASSSASVTSTATPAASPRSKRQSPRPSSTPRRSSSRLSHPPGHAQFDFGEAVVEIAGDRTQGPPGADHPALLGHLLPQCLSEGVHRDLPGRPRRGLRVLRRGAQAHQLRQHLDRGHQDHRPSP